MNEGVMLTVIFLMRALDPVEHKDETYELLNRLIDCDNMRKEYYKDLRKYRINSGILIHAFLTRSCSYVLMPVCMHLCI